MRNWGAPGRLRVGPLSHLPPPQAVEVHSAVRPSTEVYGLTVRRSCRAGLRYRSTPGGHQVTNPKRISILRSFTSFALGQKRSVVADRFTVIKAPGTLRSQHAESRSRVSERAPGIRGHLRDQPNRVERKISCLAERGRSSTSVAAPVAASRSKKLMHFLRSPQEASPG